MRPANPKVSLEKILTEIATAGNEDELALKVADPMWRFVTGRLRPLGFHKCIALVTTVVTAVSAFLVLGGGAIVSYWVYPDADFIRVGAPGHLLYALVVTFVYTPVLWAIYLWQPPGIARMLLALERNGVIEETAEGNLEDFKARLIRCTTSRFLLAAVVVAVLTVLALETCAVIPREIAVRGQPFYWFYDKRYYWLVFVPCAYATVYIALMLAAKGLAILVLLFQAFRQFRVKVHPLHRDGVGGLRPLGSFALKYSLIAVGLGGIAATLTVARVLTGTDWNYIDALLMYAAYVVLTPLSLILPMVSAHQAMTEARSEVLSDISTEFDRAIERLRVEPPSSKDWGQHLETAATLVHMHRFVRESYPTWPISLAGFKRFAITAAIPLVTGVGSIAVDFMRG